MERKIYTDNFERLLKEKSDEFRMYPSKRVWHSIYNDLHPGRKWPSIAMSMLLVTALVFIGYLNTNDNTSKKTLAGIPRSYNKANNAGNSSSTTDQNLSPLSNDHIQLPNLAGILNDIIPVEALKNTIANSSGTVSSNKHEASVTADNKGNRFIPAEQTSLGTDLTESIDTYIKTNQLLADIAELNKQTRSATVNTAPVNFRKGDGITELNKIVQNTSPVVSVTPVSELNTKEENKVNSLTENPSLKNNAGTSKKTLSAEDKAWLEDYALHNKSQRKKWKDRVAMELYVTPGIGYRNFSDNIKNEAAAIAFAPSTPLDKSVSQKPGLGLEAGFGLLYSFAKNIRLKSGVQLNYTSYGIYADQTNHPILTTLMLNDPYTDRPYLSTRTSTLSNSSGLQSVTVHNNTYQLSLPVGIAVKLAGNNSLEWFAGASIQPSFIFGGTTHFISSDYRSYVSDPTLLRRWNLNSGFETYLNYKMGGYTLQVGPQFRYQLLSTYTKKYTVNENLYNMGLKFGVIKGF